MSLNYYDLDSIIEMNEKVVAVYTGGYEKVQGQFTNLIIIYSAISIFLIPITQHVFQYDKIGTAYYIFFGIFSFTFTWSVIHTIRLIIPVGMMYPNFPSEYYVTLKTQYETQLNSTDHTQINNYLKTSYITELERTIKTNEQNFRKKRYFYHTALVWGLISTIPFLVCLGLDMSVKQDAIQKVELINTIDSSNFDKNSQHGKKH